MRLSFSNRQRSEQIGRKLPPPAIARRVLALMAGVLIPLTVTVAFAAGDAPGPDTSLRPLSLAEARTLALSRDEMLLQAEESIRSADADVLDARSGRLPQLNVGGTWTHNLKKPSFFLPADMAAAFGGATSIEMGGDWDLQAAASLTWNLWTAGRLSAAGGAAAEALAATKWQKAAVLDAVVYTVDASYHATQLTATRVEIAEQARVAAAEALRVTDAAFAEGTASRFEQLRAQVELANREAPVVQARNALRMQQLQLLRLCGLAPGTRLELTDPLTTTESPVDLDSLLARMRKNSPELNAMRHVVGAQRQSVQLARAARGPVVQLQGTYALQGQWNDNIFPDSNDAVSSASAALAVSIPIFDGFSARAGIQRSEASLRSAEIELERVTADRELSVRQARLNLINALVALDGRQEAVDLAAEAHRLVLIRVENGMATALERLDAELAWTEARVQLAESLYNCNLAEAGLELAVGGNQPLAGATEEMER